jgi:hypothetical protein
LIEIALPTNLAGETQDLLLLLQANQHLQSCLDDSAFCPEAVTRCAFSNSRSSISMLVRMSRRRSDVYKFMRWYISTPAAARPAGDRVNSWRFDANFWDPSLRPAEAVRRAGRPAGFENAPAAFLMARMAA